MDLNQFPAYFREYTWHAKHHLFGYPADSFPQFFWIQSLEDRFAWLRENAGRAQTSSIYLLREMIQWGGSQNGVLQKFDDGLGEVSLLGHITRIVDAVQRRSRRDAIAEALKLPGMGLTYASKLLRFIEPTIFGALDSRIRQSLTEPVLGIRVPQIYDDREKSMVDGYEIFLDLLDAISQELANSNIARPQCSLAPARTTWRPADVEMALFRWAEVRRVRTARTPGQPAH
jgi:hypothetical protein